MIKLTAKLRSFFEKKNIKSKIEELDNIINSENFWSDKKNAENVIKEKNNLTSLVNLYDLFQKENSDLYDIFVLAEEENNTQVTGETISKFQILYTKVKNLEIKCFLSNENDLLDAYLEFHAGAGGTESQDWADILRRTRSGVQSKIFH